LGVLSISGIGARSGPSEEDRVPRSFQFAREARQGGKSERTRALLMDAATGVFARHGFDGASVSDIVREAEVANGTFYTHFADKGAIAAAVAYGIAQRLIRELDEAMVEVEDAVERVSFGARQFIELASRNPDWGGASFTPSGPSPSCEPPSTTTPGLTWSGASCRASSPSG